MTWSSFTHFILANPLFPIGLMVLIFLAILAYGKKEAGYGE